MRVHQLSFACVAFHHSYRPLSLSLSTHPTPPTHKLRCGDLAQKVERYKRRRQYIDENVIWRYLVQCLKALQYLHERGICHRDIKAANTFLAEDGSIKLGDMNVSKRLQKGQLQTQIGTPYYMSPEIWNNRPYDASADLWALGCMIYGTLRGLVECDCVSASC